ncbi:hypothetical protein T484DRAFT_1961779 [Baffinella frigidus]|nr:hypothetical protein T484DRAFT_1961779 [Cryptophyta sp. CCMP2293]
MPWVCCTSARGLRALTPPVTFARLPPRGGAEPSRTSWLSPPCPPPPGSCPSLEARAASSRALLMSAILALYTRQRRPSRTFLGTSGRRRVSWSCPPPPPPWPSAEGRADPPAPWVCSSAGSDRGRLSGRGASPPSLTSLSRLGALRDIVFASSSTLSCFVGLEVIHVLSPSTPSSVSPLFQHLRRRSAITYRLDLLATGRGDTVYASSNNVQSAVLHSLEMRATSASLIP